MIEETTPDPLLIEAIAKAQAMLPRQPRRWMSKYGGIIPANNEDKDLKKQYRKTVRMCVCLIS